MEKATVIQSINAGVHNYKSAYKQFDHSPSEDGPLWYIAAGVGLITFLSLVACALTL